MIRQFENFGQISDYILEEIELGKTDPFPIKNNMYKSGDYICSSFMIGDREVIVSSILIPSTDITPITINRHYKSFSNYTSQFGIYTDQFIYVGFMEYSNGKYNEFDNVDDNLTLFRKMSTIVHIILNFIEYYKIDYIIFNSIDNDPKTGKIVSYKKRDKFYELYLAHHKIKYHKIKHQFNINGEIISDFYLLDLNKK